MFNKKELLNNLIKIEPIILTFTNNNGTSTSITNFSFTTLKLEEHEYTGEEMYDYVSTTIEKIEFTCNYGETKTFDITGADGILLDTNLDQISICAGGSNKNSMLDMSGLHNISADYASFCGYDYYLIINNNPSIIMSYTKFSMPCPC